MTESDVGTVAFVGLMLFCFAMSALSIREIWRARESGVARWQAAFLALAWFFAPFLVLGLTR